MLATKLTRLTVLAAALASSSVALASGTTHPQTHHCKLADGSMDLKKTHKQCTAAKGTWAKDAAAPTDAAKPAPAPVAKPAPAPTK